jgi:hypothetical protein
LILAWCGLQRKQFRQERSMSANTFLATTGHGLARTTPGPNDDRQMELLFRESSVVS